MSAIKLGYSLGDESNRPTVLPATGVPVFLWFGDGNAEGFQATGTQVNTHPLYGDATLGTLTPNYAQYWDKWLDETGANVWDASARLTLADPAGAQFRKVHPRLGTPAATGAYTGLLNNSPVWGFAQRLFGQFVDPNGVALPIRIIKCAVTYSSMGPAATTAALSWAPSVSSGIFDLATEYYVKPAINDIVGDTLRPFVVGMFHSAGHLDGAGETAFAGEFDGLAEDWTANVAAFRQALSEYMGIGPIPTIWMQAFPTVAASLGANALTEQKTILLQQQSAGPQMKFIQADLLPKQSNSLFLNGSGSWKLGMRAATTYKNWLAGNPEDLFAWEATTIA